MLTWYSVMAPLVSLTCCSLIHALWTLRTVLFALSIPCVIASSKLLVEVTLISETFATDISPSFCPCSKNFGGAPRPARVAAPTPFCVLLIGRPPAARRPSSHAIPAAQRLSSTSNRLPLPAFRDGDHDTEPDPNDHADRR